MGHGRPLNGAMPALAFDRAGPTGDVPLLLVHAGVADRRMWDPLWAAARPKRRDVLRVDLRGFGESAERPAGELAPHQDVLDVLAAEGIERASTSSGRPSAPGSRSRSR